MKKDNMGDFSQDQKFNGQDMVLPPVEVNIKTEPTGKGPFILLCRIISVECLTNLIRASC